MEAALCFVKEVQSKHGGVSIGDLTKDTDVIGLYFSAHWCSPCRGFTPNLVEFYNTMKANNQPMEIIYVSLDRDRSSFDEYYGTMPWYTISFDDNEAREKLAEEYGVRGIPCLIIMDTEGNIIDREGRGTVQTASDSKLPEKWKKV
ncbi:nucleoredoxin-like [Crassostrea virginica]